MKILNILKTEKWKKKIVDINIRLYKYYLYKGKNVIYTKKKLKALSVFWVYSKNIYIIKKNRFSVILNMSDPLNSRLW